MAALCAILALGSVVAFVGSARAVSADPTGVVFGDALVGTTITKNVTVTLDADSTFYYVQAFGLFDAFSADPDTCASASGPGTCNVKVSFTPPLDGAFVGDLIVHEHIPGAGDQVIDIPLSGNGLLAYSVNPTSVSFGDVPVGTTVTEDVTVTLDAGTPFYDVRALDEVDGFSADPDTCANASGPGTCNVKASFTPPSDGAFVGTLLVSENTGGDVQLKAIQLSGNGVTNNSPTADAGPDQTVNGAATVNLNAAGSSDPDGDALTYAWTQTAGPSVTASGANTATPHFTAPTGPAALTFDLQVCDTHSACDTDSVTITVRSINDQLNILYDAVKNTPPGKALGDKVKQIQGYVAANDKKDACKALDDFIGLVKAQKGKRLTNSQVADFTARATAIKTALGC